MGGMNGKPLIGYNKPANYVINGPGFSDIYHSQTACDGTGDNANTNWVVYFFAAPADIQVVETSSAISP